MQTNLMRKSRSTSWISKPPIIKTNASTSHISKSQIKFHSTMSPSWKQNIIPAKIKKINEENAAIKTFTLDVQSAEFSFKSGQWSDFFLFKDNVVSNTSPENCIVAGFSMMSSPEQLVREGYIEFAVKRTKHPLTHYLHDAAKVGDTLYIDGGHGEFYYTKERYSDKPVLLIAGGIGITPLLSILQHIHSASPSTPVTFVHSIRRLQDRLFHKRVESICKENSNIRAHWTITSTESTPPGIKQGRIDLPFLKGLNLPLDSVCFVCGPLAMVQDVSAMLKQIGMHDIHYEKWIKK